MKILHLTLKKKWFDMIASGEKLEEYRDLKKFWSYRLCGKISCDEVNGWLYNIENDVEFKQYDLIKFRHGYKKDAPAITVEFKGMRIGTGYPEWGAIQNAEYFVIKLGKIINL